MSVVSDRRVVIYPHYIASGKTVSEGRRLPKDLACEHPTVVEMQQVCQELNIPAAIEDKQYPRDVFIRCRLRISLKNAQGRVYNSDIPDRRTLLIRLAEAIKKIPVSDRINTYKNGYLAEAVASTKPGGGAGTSSSAVEGSSSKSQAKAGKKKK